MSIERGVSSVEVSNLSRRECQREKKKKKERKRREENKKRIGERSRENVIISATFRFLFVANVIPSAGQIESNECRVIKTGIHFLHSLGNVPERYE